MINHAKNWHIEDVPRDEFEKVVLWSPRPTDRPKPLKANGVFQFARYIHGQGWQMRWMGNIVTPDHHIACWMHIPPLPE
jgi:hypothetical protein